MAGGRPPKYKNAKELQSAIDDYFNEGVTKRPIPTITGLAKYLGFVSRQSFYEYEKKPE